MKKMAELPTNASPGVRASVPMAQSAALAGVPRLRLARVRSLSGMTQLDLATRLGIKQNNISKLEGREDMRLSTLKNYLTTMGGEIEILARVNGKVVLLDLPSLSATPKNSATATPHD